MTSDLTDDGFLGGRLKLLQPRRGHRVGTDAALLVAAARSRLAAGASVADFGAGVGAVGLSLALLGAARTALVEIEPGTAAIAGDNAARNGLSDRVAVVCADVAQVARGRETMLEASAPACAPETLDLVAANPPFDLDRRFRGSPDPRRAVAHQADDGLIETWTRAAARALKPRGVFVMIHRPEALDDVVAALAGRFGDLRLRPVHARADEPAIRVLIAGTKGRRGALAVLPGVTLHGPGDGFTPEADAIQRGDAAIAMG